MKLIDAAANVWDKTVTGHVADLHRMPREAVVGSPSAILYRYRPLSGVDPVAGPPVLLVPPLGAPDFAYDLRRGCSLVEHLLLAGRTVYLVDYGPMTFSDRTLGIEDWVDDVVPRAARRVASDEGSDAAPGRLVAGRDLRAARGRRRRAGGRAAAGPLGDGDRHARGHLGRPAGGPDPPARADHRRPGRLVDLPAGRQLPGADGRAGRSTSPPSTSWSPSRWPCCPGSTTGTAWPRSRPSTT